MPSSTVRERPILFSGAMVRAILDGRKTQTRRIVKPQPEENGRTTGGAPAWYWPHKSLPAGYCHTDRDSLERLMVEAGSPYGAPGDRLWVREAWRLKGGVEFTRDHRCIGYRGDPHTAYPEDRWRSPIHMPRWASRLTLEIVSVRVERLQEISEADTRAEGVRELPLQEGEPGAWWTARPDGGREFQARDPVAALRKGWDSINGERAPWSSNPWVWVVEFKPAPRASPAEEGKSDG